MSDDDLIRRGDAMRIVDEDETAAFAYEQLRALPAVDVAGVRAAALREAAAEIKLWWDAVRDHRVPDELILAMIDKPPALAAIREAAK
jgi:hypothetical protein